MVRQEINEKQSGSWASGAGGGEGAQGRGRGGRRAGRASKVLLCLKLCGLTNLVISDPLQLQSWRICNSIPLAVPAHFEHSPGVVI